LFCSRKVLGSVIHCTCQLTSWFRLSARESAETIYICY